MVVPPSIVLGLITCKRPNLLAELLDSVVPQSIFSTDLHVEIVVVDNDSEQSALPVFQEYENSLPCPAKYIVENQRGIPFARNKVLDYAVERGAKYIVFIDDDETAEPNWLLALYNVIEKEKVDGVQGTVVSLLPEKDIPRWACIAKRKTTNKKEGQPRKAMATNNVIFSTRLVTEKGLRFDETFALSGGSDIDFFNRASELGSRHIWTNTAIVYEIIPQSRLTVKWQFQRLFRVGATNAYMSVKERGYPRTILRYLPKIVSRLILGPCLFIFTGIFSRRLFLTSVHWTGSALGLILGLFGVLGKEYQTIHGS